MGSGQCLLNEMAGRVPEASFSCTKEVTGYQPPSELRGRVTRARHWETIPRVCDLWRVRPSPWHPFQRDTLRLQVRD